MKQKTGYRALDPIKLTGSIDKMAEQVGMAFPGSGLEGLAMDMSSVTRDTIELVDEISKPMWWVRIVAGILILLALV